MKDFVRHPKLDSFAAYSVQSRSLDDPKFAPDPKVLRREGRLPVPKSACNGLYTLNQKSSKAMADDLSVEPCLVSVGEAFGRGSPAWAKGLVEVTRFEATRWRK